MFKTETPTFSPLLFLDFAVLNFVFASSFDIRISSFDTFNITAGATREYCSSLLITSRCSTKRHAPGLTPRAILEKFSAIQMIDVHIPTTDSRTLVLPRYTQPRSDHKLLLHQLKLTLPNQPPPRIEILDT